MKGSNALIHSFTASIAVMHPVEPKLLCVRHPTFGKWMFPGGRVEPGEAPHTAALREVTEEVGLSVTLADLSNLPHWSHNGNIRLPHPIAMIKERLPHRPDQFYLDIVYVGTAESAQLSLHAEVSEADWLDRHMLHRLPTSFPIQELAAQIFDRLRDLRG
jgi:8-oxo-dGTP pyrophosphatase MutT (NUDIX family)